MEHGCQPFPGNKAPGHVLEQHQEHHNAHQQLGSVGNGRHDAARGDPPRRHAFRSVPQDGCNGQVQEHVYYWAHEGQGQQHLQLGMDQLVVGLAEAQLLIGLPDAGLDDADGGNIFLQNIVYPVQLFL